MEIRKRLIHHLVIISVLLITSCGYVSDKPVENIEVYKTEELQTCKIDVSKLGEIFTSDQKEQIQCLQENFVQFTKYVRSKHAGAVTEAEMGIFVKRFFVGQSDAIIKGLSLIFQLNMILLKDEADRISHSKISPLFEILVKVNQEAVILSNIIKIMDDPKNQKDFWILREKFIQSIERFSKYAVEVIEKCPGVPQKLSMKTFITDLGVKIGDSDIDTEMINSLIFAKKALIGGDKEIITSDELKKVIAKLPKIVGLGFDAYYSKEENFKTPIEATRFYLTSMRTLQSTVLFDQPDFILITSEEILKLSDKMIKNYDVKTFKPSIEVLKAKFIGGKPDSISLKDLAVVFNMVHDYLEKSYFNNLTYSEPVNNFLLSKPTPVNEKELVFKALPGYDVFRDPARLNQLFVSYKDTAVNFRYFRDKVSGSALYDTKISRNASGFNEVNISKWLSWKLLKAYGSVDKSNQMVMSMEQFSQFLLDAKPILVELKLWSPKFQTFARNALLLADLFQQQSDGDQWININEATEYIGMLLTAVDMSGKFNDSLTFACSAGPNSEDPVFELDCYNENFYEIILNKLSFRKSLPRLYSYITKVPKTEALNYLKGVEGFARDNNAPGVPVSRRDSTLVIGAMLNIESTFIRFDKNLDNVIDYDELSEAYFTYRASIIALAKLPKDQEKYAKGIFLYMVSKMEIPKTDGILNKGSFAIFNSCVQSEFCRNTTMAPVVAKRLNIGKLLYYMVNEASVAPNR